MNRKPQLLVFSHLCSPAYVTGAEKLLLFMLRELQPAYDCTLVVPNEGVIAAEARAIGFQTAVIPVPLAASFYLGLPHWRAELQEGMRSEGWVHLNRMLAQRKPDAVLVSTCVHPLPAAAAKGFGIPVVWAVMETMQMTAHTPEIAAFIDAHADRLIGISASTLIPFPPHAALRAAVIPPSWHDSELLPETWEASRDSTRRLLGFEPSVPVIGYVASSIYENKGFHHYMDATLSIASSYPQARFLIVGNPVDQPYFEANLEKARAAGMLDRYRWIRFEPRIERIYPAMDGLVVPSVIPEGFGMTALEGMIFGKAVISYASGGLEEIHAATDNRAFAVPLGDSAAMAAKLAELLADPQLLAVAGARNREAAVAAFGIEAYRGRLRAFLDGFHPAGPSGAPLVRGGGPAVYLLESGALRPFASDTALLEAGFRFEEVRQVPDEWLALFPAGAPIGKHAAPRRVRTSGRLRGKRRRRTGRRRSYVLVRSRRRTRRGSRGKRRMINARRRVRRIGRIRRTARLRRAGRIRRRRRIR